MIVLDASAAVDFLLDIRPAADRIRERILRPGERLHAPHLLDLEILAAVRRRVRREVVSVERERLARAALVELRAVRHPPGPLLGRIWELRHNLTVFDAAYVALAESLRAPLITCDAKLVGVPGVHARVELVA